MSNKFSARNTGLPRRLRHSGAASLIWLGAAAALILVPFCLRADQVEMQNGDRYLGTVLSMSADVLVLENDVLGTVRLPRGKVAHIRMRPAAATETAIQGPRTNAQPRATLVAETNAAALSLPPLKTNATSIQQVREQFLSDGSPEAKAKFNELAGGLLTGKLSVADIRAQAKSAAEQLRALKAGLGEDAGIAVDGYLAILDRFLNEGQSAANAATNAPAKPPRARPEPPVKEE